MTNKNVNRTLLPRAGRDKNLRQPEQHESELKQKQRISDQLKQKYIQDLQERNRKLRSQIQKITDIIEQNEQRQKQSQKQIKKQYKSMVGHSAQENNPQLLKKQLQNVYKQIKNYERQIQKVQNNRSGGRISSDQIARLEVIRYEKLQHLDKLKTQLLSLSNTQVLNSRRLKNNMGREYYQNIIVKFGEQLKVLRQKQRHLQEKQKKKVINAKKQLDYIKKLEGQLVQSGVPMDQIQELKRKNIYTQIKNIMNGQKDNDKPIQQAEPLNPDLIMNQEEIITFQKLQQLKNQVKLYKKLHQDYEKRLSSILKQKQLSDKLISDRKKIIQDRNIQIQKLNQEVNEVKQLVRKNNNVTNGTIGGSQPDSIRKNPRKKSIEASQQMSKSKQNDAKSDSKKNTIKNQTKI